MRVKRTIQDYPSPTETECLGRVCRFIYRPGDSGARWLWGQVQKSLLSRVLHSTYCTYPSYLTRWSASYEWDNKNLLLTFFCTVCLNTEGSLDRCVFYKWNVRCGTFCRRQLHEENCTVFGLHIQIQRVSGLRLNNKNNKSTECV